MQRMFSHLTILALLLAPAIARAELPAFRTLLFAKGRAPVLLNGRPSERT